MNNARSGDRMFVPLYSCEMLVPYLNRDVRDSVIPVPDPSMPFTMDVSADDWEKSEGGYRIAIDKGRHNRGVPSIVLLFRRSEGRYAAAELHTDINADGDVLLLPSERIEGRIVIM